jgi:hypothetical protein
LIFRAWKYSWSRFAAAFLIGSGGGYFLFRVIGLNPESLFKISTTGVRHVTGPFVAEAAGRGIDPAAAIFLTNSIALLFLVSFLYSARLYDPSRADKLSVWFYRRARRDPMVKILELWSSFRSIEKAELRPLYPVLLVGPVIGVAALGVLVGTLCVSFAFTVEGGSARSVIMALAYICPHGFFEIGSLLLGASIPISAYMNIEENIIKGDTEGVFRHLREAGSSRAVRPVLGTALIMLAAAALIEAHITATVARTIGSLF